MFKYRQGDVALQIVDAPKGLEFKRAKHAVLAEGEATGHFHVLTCPEKVGGGPADGTEWPLEVAEKDGTMYLRVLAPLPLKHAEHATITIEPGIYKRSIQREYTPEAIRQVID